MATFIHLADQRDEKSILKNGIRMSRCRDGSRGVYAVPVVLDFSVTHQWARELKRTGVRTLICVQFKITDDELVEIGPYNKPKEKMTAAEASHAVATHQSPMGLEILIPRKIFSKEITRTYLAPRVAGWRYYPGAKGRHVCHCEYCNRGEIKGRRRIRDDES